MDSSGLIHKHFDEHLDLAKASKTANTHKLKEVSLIISRAIATSGTLFLCGNGGSASDSQHLAAEFVGRFENERKPLRAQALTTDSSVITCISNDYGYEYLFSRQLDAFGRQGDILLVISTSGKSKNIIRVLEKAREKSIYSIALLGKGGGAALSLANMSVLVPSDSTPRIQEMHTLYGHIICDLVEKQLGHE